MAFSATKNGFSRPFSLSFRIYGPKIGPPLKSRKEIEEFLDKRLWSLQELLESPGKDPQIAPETVDKMRKLSGLGSNSDSVEREKLTKVLNTQMRFIQHLYSKEEQTDTAQETSERSNDSIFRLLASDFREPEPLGLHEILQQIEKLPNEVDPEKGEASGSIRDLLPETEVLFKVVTKEVDQRKS